MSTQARPKRLTAPDITARKGGEPIVALTAYSAPAARLSDPHCDFLLVGDSVGMVLYGLDSTIPVPLELMIAHGQAVVRGSSRALVVVDLPFGAYEESPAQAFRNAARVLKETGCGAIKLEGGQRMADTIRFLADRGIPVMAHIGLTPQFVHAFGGFKVQGRLREQWEAIESDALAVTAAGAFSVVLEAIPGELAERITKAIAIPTIGIGASAACDGQILVLDDMLGLTPRVAKFVKPFGRVGEEMAQAIAAYAGAVRTREFPAQEHTYRVMEGGVAPPNGKPTGKAARKSRAN